MKKKLRHSKVSKATPVDEWGDEGTWVTVVDFTKTKRGGIPVEELLQQLRAFSKRKTKNSKK